MSKSRLSLRRSSRENGDVQNVPLSPMSTISTYSASSPSPFSPSGSVLSSPATITSPIEPGSSSFPWRDSNDRPPVYSAKAERHVSPLSAKARLQQIAEEIGVSLSRNRTPLVRQSNAPTYLTDADSQEALKVLGERRLSDPEYKPPKGLSKLTKSKAKLEEFSDKEINRAFRAVVEGNGRLGLVQAFLAMGASVDVVRRASTSLWKKMTSKDQVDRRNDVLQLATRSGSNELVQLLAAHADQQSRDESLLLAVYQNDLRKTQTLLEFDASIFEAHDVFLSAVDNGDADLVELLLAAPKLPCTECRAKALIKASTTSSLRIVSALLFSEADTQYDNAKAMHLAAQKGDLAVAVSIASCQKPPSSPSLDAAAAVAYKQIEDYSVRLSMLEICLCGGAHGESTNQLLILATEENEFETVELLLRHNVSANYESGKSLCTAVSKGQDSIFTAILGSKLNAVTLGNGLVAAVGINKLSLDFCTRLLEKGASVNYDNASPLVTAINAHANEILEIFLSKLPSTRSLAIALEATLQWSGQNRMAPLLLLLSEGMEQNALDEALVELTKQEPNDMEATSALLDAGASPEYKDGLCVMDAARRFELSTLKLLDRAVSSKAYVFSQAATAAVDDNTDWLQPDGLAVLKFLLENGAFPSALGEALGQAAALFHLKALDFLSDWIEPGDAYTLAFARATEVGEKWHSSGGLDVIRILLEKGAKGDIVDGALLLAEERYINGRAPEAIIDILLKFKASVNYDDGHAIEIAVKAGHMKLLEKLFGSSPNKRTLSRALSTALISGHPVQKLMNMIDALFGKEGEIPDPNYVVAGLDPPIYLALENYPTSAPLAKRLLELGCNVETKLSFKVFGDVSPQEEAEDDFGAENRLILRTNHDDLRDEYNTNKSINARMISDESNAPAEDVTPLVWACCQVGDQSVNAAVFEVLLDFKADANFITKHSKSTPLLLASRYQRPDLLSLLVKQQINVSIKDKFGRSALFFIAGNGDVKSTKILLQCKPRNNDGSLHEAARELHTEVVSLLIKGGHDVNFTSTKHEGLTALGELAMYSDGKGFDSRIEDCIELLVRGKVDATKKWRGKTVLYMALDNPEPYPVTSALLERLMWKYTTHSANIYSEEDLYYSPTMYLQKGYFLGSESDRAAIIQMLKDHGAENHYYASEGSRQPEDAVGMPPHIIQSERRRRQHEERIARKQEEHEASLQHNWELAQQQHQVQAAQQLQYLQHQEQRFEQQQNHLYQAAYNQAQVQYQRDMQKLQTERESARIIAEQETYKLETQWQSNRLQAQANQNRVLTKQRMVILDSHAQRQLVASNYQLQRQNVQARGAIAIIQARSDGHALAVRQQNATTALMEQYARNQRSNMSQYQRQQRRMIEL